MAENSDQILHFHEYFKIIRNRLWVIFTIFALTVLSGYYVTNYVLPKVYQASAQIQINAARILEIGGIGGNTTENHLDSNYFQSEFLIMQSPDVLKPIISDLQLDKIWAKRVYKSSLEQLPMQDALAYMGSILHLDFTRNTNIIEITVSSEVPKECADVANAVADRYKTKRDIDEDQRNTRGIDSLREQIAQQQESRRGRASEGGGYATSNLAKRVSMLPSSTGPTVTERLEQDLDARNKDLLAGPGGLRCPQGFAR